MSFVQLIIPLEVAHDALHELAILGNVQFQDVSPAAFIHYHITYKPLYGQLNPSVNPFQRSYVNEIRRIDEMSRRIRFFQTQIDKETEKIENRPIWDSAPLVKVGPRVQQTMDELDVKLAEHEKRLNQMNESYKTLSERLKEAVEAKHVLRETAAFFNKVTLFYGLLNEGMC
jgi:V-type H+-transporting ATPase subunit a